MSFGGTTYLVHNISDVCFVNAHTECDGCDNDIYRPVCPSLQHIFSLIRLFLGVVRLGWADALHLDVVHDWVAFVAFQAVDDPALPPPAINKEFRNHPSSAPNDSKNILNWNGAVTVETVQ